MTEWKDFESRVSINGRVAYVTSPSSHWMPSLFSKKAVIDLTGVARANTSLLNGQGIKVLVPRQLAELAAQMKGKRTLQREELTQRLLVLQPQLT